MNRACDVDCQKKFPCVPDNSVYHGACFGRGPTLIEDLAQLPADWEREIIFHCKSIVYLDILLNHSVIHPFLQFLYLWNDLLYRGMTFSQLVAQSIHHISWIFRIRVSRSVFSRRANSSCCRACSLRDSSHPHFALSNSNRWEWACRWSSRIQVLRVSTLQSCFKISDFASASKWSLCSSRSDFTEFPDERIWITVRCFPKTCWCLREKSSLSENISWFDLFLLENNATCFSSLFGSWDELDIESLTEWQTCDRSAFASRSCKSNGEASRARICSSSKSDSGGGVAMLSAES